MSGDGFLTAMTLELPDAVDDLEEIEGPSWHYIPVARFLDEVIHLLYRVEIINKFCLLDKMPKIHPRSYGKAGLEA